MKEKNLSNDKILNELDVLRRLIFSSAKKSGTINSTKIQLAFVLLEELEKNIKDTLQN